MRRWADVTLEVTTDQRSRRLEFGLGPDGVCGRDAARLKEAFNILFEPADLHSCFWADLLSGNETRGFDFDDLPAE
jgi:hypothetical protein